MLILLTHSVGSATEDEVLAANVVYRPDVERKGPAALARALAETAPDVLIARSHPGADAVRAWRGARPEGPLVAIATEPSADGAALERLGILAGGLPPAAGDSDRDSDAFALAERTWSAAVARAERARLAPPTARPGATVALVGAGIVNLVTALRLVREGCAVTLYDACPDPRRGGEWTAFGCTRGGDNARMFTLTEADSYNDRSWPASGEVNTLLDRPVSQCGWRICGEQTLTAEDRRWADEYRRVPTWLARELTEDILLFNREARDEWDRLMEDEPRLFADVELRRDILRLYSDPGRWRAQVARQDRVGATLAVLEPPDVAERHPGLADACASGALAGGIEVVGFTVNVHDHVARLLDALEDAGAQLRWSQRVAGIHWAERVVAAGLVVDDALVTADHYVLSPGAYGGGVLRGTLAEHEIGGVLGVWMTLPNVEPAIEHSMKLARTGHRAEDANITLGRDCDGGRTLIVGSGYGWTGADPANIDRRELEGLFEAVEENARTYFPRAYAVAEERGTLRTSRRVCVRPWTASSLGVFEMVEAQGGGLLVVTGGHNTGGFAQAPAIANAVLAAMRGQPHPMHTLYHPARLRRFYERGIAPAVPAAPAAIG